jgi:hypothetical protein
VHLNTSTRKLWRVNSTTGTNTPEVPPGSSPGGAQTVGTTDDLALLTIMSNIDGLADIDDTPELPAHEQAASPEAALRAMLTSARRRLVPIRRAFVQLPRTRACRVDLGPGLV